MKRKDKDELKNNDITSLAKKVKELRKQMSAERLNMMTKEVKNRHIVKTLRRNIAIMKTYIAEKSMAVK